MYRISLAMAIAFVALASAAAPAGAQAPFVGPNCSGAIVSGAVIGIGAPEAAANAGFDSVQEAHDFIGVVCANAQESSPPPRCEVGQLQAAEQALARGDLEAYMFHLGVLFACFTGEPPGPPL
jgi:hypothetical protein